MALTLDGTNGISSSGAISSSSNITATGTITTQSATGVIFSDSSNQGAAASPFSLKNRIINGDMVIDQRNAGASVTPANGAYTIDRWYVAQTATASRFSVQQNAGAVTRPAGFTNYLGATSLSAYSVAATDQYALRQMIEGFNVADLSYGTASAATITLSFWVRSSLTGTFGGSFYNQANDKSYVFSYTISAANTWEYKTITVPGDTATALATNNSASLLLNLSIGYGSTFSRSFTGTWVSGFFGSVTGATSVVGTNGATFYVTGVQLERNTTATPFEWLPYSTELALCQRYFYVIRNNVAGVQYNVITLGAFNTTRAFGAFVTPVPLRANPTFTFNSVALRTPDTNTTANVTNIYPVQSVTVVPFPAYVPVEINVASGLTSNVYYGLAFQASTNDFVALSSEL
jgi:hypothetical protein